MDFSELLSADRSHLSRVLRAALAGLAQTLQTAQSLVERDDPGQPACSRVVRELRHLLESAPVAAAHPVTEPALVPEALGPQAMPVASEPAGDLSTLRQAFLDATELQTELHAFTLPEAGNPDLWRLMNLLLLRVSAATADHWRNELQRVAGAACNADAVVALPGATEEMVFPGLGLSPRAPLDPRLGSGPFPGTTQVLAQVVSGALWFVDNDPMLHHALRSVYRFGLILLQGTQKSRYVKALLERFQRLQAAEQGSDMVEVVQAWLDLDEALHSLLHNPPASSSSWWASWQRRARETLVDLRERTVVAGHTLHLQNLSGRYADVRQFTDAEGDCDVAGNVPPGDVVSCLRIFARLDGNSLPGRVLYRPR